MTEKSRTVELLLDEQELSSYMLLASLFANQNIVLNRIEIKFTKVAAAVVGTARIGDHEQAASGTAR